MALGPTRMTDLEAPVPITVVASPPMVDMVAAIYDAHQRELFTFALRACRDREVAEDLVHESYLRLIVEIQDGGAPSNVRAWLYRVTANQAITRGRRANVAQKWQGRLGPGQTTQDPESEFLDQGPIGREVGVPEVRQQTPPGSDHLEQSATAVMILGVGAEVIGERVDPLGEQRHLDPGRAGVLVVLAVLGHDALLVVRHAALSLFVFVFVDR